MAAIPDNRPQTTRKAYDNPDFYARAWEVYQREPRFAAVAKALGCPLHVARRVCDEGFASLELPPLKTKLRAILALVQQMDADEAAKYIALGRGAIRQGIQTYSKALSNLAPSSIPPSMVVPHLATLVMLNEKLSRTQREDEPPLSEDDVANVLAGLLTTIAAGRLPGGQKLLEEGNRITIIEGEAEEVPLTPSQERAAKKVDPETILTKHRKIGAAERKRKANAVKPGVRARAEAVARAKARR